MVRESALVARPDGRGNEVLVVHRPVTFTLDEAALALHAVVDPYLARSGSRHRVGRGRVRDALRQIVSDGWPEPFTPDARRVAYWRRWLIDHAVYSDDANR